MSGQTYSFKIVSVIAVIIAFQSSCTVVSATEETPAHPGVIRGTVVDGVSGEAIGGAYVGVGGNP